MLQEKVAFSMRNGSQPVSAACACCAVSAVCACCAVSATCICRLCLLCCVCRLCRGRPRASPMLRKEQLSRHFCAPKGHRAGTEARPYTSSLWNLRSGMDDDDKGVAKRDALRGSQTMTVMKRKRYSRDKASETPLFTGEAKGL